ncbi:MAG: beta-ketoacyl-[acyl-carrier-protein] synthase family protein [Alphaproteobacteria bacterium]|nr:beta-ketoacyl-[acyl-carrier-protein] synthase family protein [Alphaproteobacteria bacterium]
MNHKIGMENRKIVITGMGVVSALGNDVEAFRRRLFDGAGGIGTMTFDARGQNVSFAAAPVQDFAIDAYMDAKKASMLDRFSQFAVAAAVQAFRDSGLTLTDEAAERMAVITGTGVGGQNTLEESYYKLLDPAGSGRVHPFTIPRLMANAGSSQISMALGIRGPGFTVASACASAVHAMGVTLSMLRSGLIDSAVTGGAEACLTYGTLKGWEALRVMAPDVCRPFSAGRTGMVLGEGAAMFVLETEENARKRGAKIYAEFAGFGMSSDARDITTPDAAGAARAIVNCLRDARLSPEDVDYINAHGTGTRANDATETAAVKIALGDHARRVALSSSKSMLGHALGAAGALEMLATVLAVRENIAPPTINYLEPDPECDLDYVPNAARAMPVGVALNNSFAFGGLNAVVAVRKMA